MFKNVNLAGIVSRSQISRKFHPHTELVAWELNSLAAVIPRYGHKIPDGPGLNMILISVGTNDAARLQRLGGIRNQIDLDHLIHIGIAEWPRQIVEMLDGATTCLDQFGKAYVILPIGTFDASNTNSGIEYFRSLVVKYAKQYSQVVVVNNSNMIKNDKAITYMIDRNDPPPPPHHSDRGHQQFVANLLAAIRQHQPAAYAYIDVVREHVMHMQYDKDHPSPHA